MDLGLCERRQTLPQVLCHRFLFLLQAVLGALALHLPQEGRAQSVSFLSCTPNQTCVIARDHTQHSQKNQNPSRAQKAALKAPCVRREGWGGAPPPWGRVLESG